MWTLFENNLKFSENDPKHVQQRFENYSKTNTNGMKTNLQQSENDPKQIENIVGFHWKRYRFSWDIILESKLIPKMFGKQSQQFENGPKQSENDPKKRYQKSKRLEPTKPVFWLSVWWLGLETAHLDEHLWQSVHVNVKRFENDLKTIRKRFETIWKRSEHYSKTVWKRSETIPGCCINGLKTIWKWFQNDLKMLSKRFENDRPWIGKHGNVNRKR